MKTNVVIFATKQDVSELIMDQLIQKWEEPIIKRTKDTVETATRFIRARKWQSNQRGIRAHELYIDCWIDSEAIKNDIITRLRPMPDEQLSKDWNWKDHVHYF